MKRTAIAIAAVAALVALGCQSTNDGKPASNLQPNRTVQGGNASTNSPGTISTNTNRGTVTRPSAEPVR
jgi:outer membrane lipoprotein SlyB